MRRRVAFILVFVAIGAVLNIAVAWACAAWVNPLNGQVQFSHRLVKEPKWESISLQSGFGHTRINTFVGGLRISDEGRSTYGVLNLGVPGEIARCDDQAGWPLRSLSCSTEDVVVIRTGHLATSASLSYSQVIVNWGISLSKPFKSALPDNWRALPLQPLWKGMIVNTGFYAMLLWMLSRMPTMIRRKLRSRRGACCNCGYDLRGHDRSSVDATRTCPECGHRC